MGVPATARRAIAAAATYTFTDLPAGTTVAIYPGSGGTMTAKVRLTSEDALIDLDPDTPTYSAAATRVLLGPVKELVFAAATAAGVGSIAY
jgi:hypothetical protein